MYWSPSRSEAHTTRACFWDQFPKCLEGGHSQTSNAAARDNQYLPPLDNEQRQSRVPTTRSSRYLLVEKALYTSTPFFSLLFCIIFSPFPFFFFSLSNKHDCIRASGYAPSRVKLRRYFCLERVMNRGEEERRDEYALFVWNKWRFFAALKEARMREKWKKKKKVKQRLSTMKQHEFVIELTPVHTYVNNSIPHVGVLLSICLFLFLSFVCVLQREAQQFAHGGWERGQKKKDCRKNVHTILLHRLWFLSLPLYSIMNDLD